MIILTVRTDKPESELGLFDDRQKLQYNIWQAHRALGETIHLEIEELLKSQGIGLHDIQGIVAYEGPGSFTGLRIGMSVVNALTYALKIPVTAQTGDDWIDDGITELLSGNGQAIALPEYGAPVHITTPKH